MTVIVLVVRCKGGLDDMTVIVLVVRCKGGLDDCDCD